MTILVERIIYRNPETSWAVIAVRANGKHFNANGVLPQVSPQQTLNATGSWQEHPRYGRQFAISTAYPSKSYTADGIFKYLSSGKFKGIGKVTARKIVDTFGDETMKILNHDSQQLYKVPKVSKKIIDGLVEVWKNSRTEAEVLAALSDLHIPLHLGHKIIEEYKDRTLDIVQRDPYKIPFDIKGFGFQVADNVGLSLGMKEDSIERIRGAIGYFLQTNERSGHCYMTESRLVYEIEKNLPLSLRQQSARQHFETALQNAKNDRHVVRDQNDNRQTIYYRSILYYSEVYVAQKIGQMIANQPKSINITSTLAPYSELSEEQIRAAGNSFHHQLSVITGAAGTGKTTTIRMIIKIAKDNNLKLALCAPTGRAACRLKEVTDVEAKTIHRLLEWQPHEKKFKRKEGSELTEDVVVVDEVSMVDIWLAQALFEALKPKTRVVLVGDANQLPSVGAGNFLADLLNCSSVPSVRLSRIFRQGKTSQIISNAHRIINGDQDGYVSGDDFLFIEQPVERIVDHIKKYLGQFPKAQILSPIYRGPLGVDALNDAVKRWTHGAKYQPEFQVGDKVIQTSNNYNLGVYNGDIGKIVSIEKKILVVDFNGRAVTYDSTNSYDLKLAYAISIHKSQGSEFPTVIMPLVSQHHIMLNKNLTYTAITRAKEQMIVIGSAEVFKRSARRDYDLRRQTRLTSRLNQFNGYEKDDDLPF